MCNGNPRNSLHSVLVWHGNPRNSLHSVLVWHGICYQPRLRGAPSNRAFKDTASSYNLYLPDSDVLSSDAGEATATVQKKRCDECAEDTVAVAVCMDCGDNFCTDHARVHPTSRRS